MTLRDIEFVPIADVEKWPGNARVGDVGRIAASLETHGQFRPILLQRSSGRCIAGNHTHDAHLHLHAMDEDERRLFRESRGIEPFDQYNDYSTIAATWLDVDDDQAEEILLVDNKTQDEADYDWDALTEILTRRGNNEAATGFTSEEVKALEATREWNAQIAAEAADALLGGTVEPESVDDIEDDPAGVVRLNADTWFDSADDRYGIPLLRLDRIPEIPDDMGTWAGPVIAEQDGEHDGYVYMYSSDSTRGMPWAKTLVAFFIHDQRFENWWSDPAHYVQRILNMGGWGIVVPDYSMFIDMPEALRVYNCYRSYWIGRFAQEAGLQVVPNLVFGKDEDLDWSLAGIPEGAPTVCVQMQTGERNDPAEDRRVVGLIDKAWDEKRWGTLLVYSGPHGRKIMAKSKASHRVVFVPNRAELKDEWRLDRDNGQSH